MDASDVTDAEAPPGGLQKKSWPKQLLMLCCRRRIWVKYSLFSINFLVCVSGLCMVAVGVWARLERQKLGPLDSMSTDPAYLLAALGGVMFLITVSGCVGALREHVCLLKLFCVIIALTFVMEVIGGVVTFTFLQHIRRSLLANFRNAMVTYQDDTQMQGAVDYVQQQYHCCGASTYQDWDSNIYFNCSSPAMSRCGVPMSCCKSYHGNTRCGFHTRKLPEHVAEEIIFTMGCIHPLMDSFKNSLVTIAILAFGIGLIEIVSMILANMLLRDLVLRKGKVFTESTSFNLQEKGYDAIDTSPRQ